MISYPFESQNTGSVSAPVYDRAITAEQERKFNKMRYTNGVFSTPTNGLMVQAKSGMTVTVKAGGCHIEGALGVLEADLDISISASNASQSRIDRIVARFDTSVSVRSLDIYKKEGVLSSNPQPPDIVRESNYYEIVLADIRVSAGTSEITNANITDQRENSDLCGLVVPAIPTPLDLDDIYLQYQASLDEYLDIVASALDETTAGHLQGLLDSVIGKNSASSMSVIPTPAFGWGNWNGTNAKYLMITLPKAARNIMAFDICLTMHTYGQAVYHVEGAVSASYTWNVPTNCYATGIVDQSYTSIHDLPVRFGHDSEHAYIIIGDGVASMYNLGVVIRNFSVYGTQREGYDVLAGYQDGWIIDCVSEFNNITIDKIIEHPSMLYDYEISDETIAAFEAIGWTPPSGGGSD